MKWQPLLAFGSIFQVVAGLKLIDESEDNGVICYTYLSTYLAVVDAGPAPALPTTRGILPPYFTNRSTSAVPLSTLPVDRESSVALQDPDSTLALPTSTDFAILTEFTDLFSSTAAISSEASATSSQAEVTGQAVIFFVSPDTDNQRRSLVKRDIPGGFVNGVNPVDICTDADIFQLADGQLLDNGSPVYYNGEPYKQFASDGTPPDGAITREFAAVNGRLVFASRSLPSNNAGFCQDDTGQVYITFGSSPPGCDPIILLVYTAEQCRDGEIPGPAQASSIISEPTSTVLADPTDVSASSDTALAVTATSSTVIAEEEEETITAGSSSTDIPPSAPLFTSSLSLTASEMSTIESQSASLFPMSSSTESIGTTVSEDVPSSSESSSGTSSSIVLSTDSTAMEPATEETTTSVSTTLPEGPETSTSPTPSVELETATTGKETTATDESTTAAETTTTAEETTTTTEETTTAIPSTTTECDSVTALTATALLNPTPVFDDTDDHDDDLAAVVLPFNVAYSDQSTVYVSTNGFIGVGSDLDSNPGENSWLPTGNIAPIAVCPYWADLSLIRRNGDTIVYEVFDGQHGMQATFEWIVTSPNDIMVHFSTTFYKDFPQIYRFSYYNIDETGRMATTGAQNNDRDEYFELYGFVKDGVSLFISTDVSDFESLTFDNTECGKGDPPDGAAAFGQGT